MHFHIINAHVWNQVKKENIIITLEEFFSPLCLSLTTIKENHY